MTVVGPMRGSCVLFAIASAEKQKKRKALEEMGLDPIDVRWLDCWCRAGANSFAYRKGGALSTVRMALARAEYEGLIDVIRRGSNRTAYRRLNVPALKLLRNQLPKHPDYIAEMEKRMIPQPMDFLELMDENTQIPDWISDHMKEWLSAVREHGAIKFQFANLYERDLTSFALPSGWAERFVINRVEGSEADPTQQPRRLKKIDKTEPKKAVNENQHKVAYLIVRDKQRGAQFSAALRLMQVTSPKPDPFSHMRDDDEDGEETLDMGHVDPVRSDSREKLYASPVPVPEFGTDQYKSVAYKLAEKLAEWRSDPQPDLAKDSRILLPLASEGVEVVLEVLKWSRTNVFWNEKLMEVGAKMLRKHFGAIRAKMTASQGVPRAPVECPTRNLEPISGPWHGREVIPFGFDEAEDEEGADGREPESEEEDDDLFLPQQAPLATALTRSEKAALSSPRTA